MNDGAVGNAGGDGSSAGAGPCPPPRIPDHELVRCIGRGSYGEVWLARNALGTWRAVKVVHRARFDTDRPYEREFEGVQKYEPVSRTHPGLVQILQVGRDDAAGYFYCVMELADGLENGAPGVDDGYIPKTLDRWVRQRGRLPFDECLDIGLRLSAALDHLHANELVHRDIKPSNVIFVAGYPKLADIGLVTDAGEHQSLVGTQGFVAPEGAGSTGADIFSLGKLLYEIATGKPAERFPEPVSDLARSPELAFLQEWNEVVLRACDSNPAKRYPTAAELRRELLLLEAGESLGRRHAIERVLRRTARVSVAVATIVSIAAATLLLVHGERERRLRAELDVERTRLASAENEARLNAEKAALASDLVAQQVERLFSEDRSAEAIGHLSRLLRKDPSNEVAIQRLMSALTSRTFAMPLAPPPMRHETEVYIARFDSTGQRIVTGSRDGTARIWNARTADPISPPLRHGGPVRWAEFSPDGRRIATASEDGSARIWDAGNEFALIAELKHEESAPVWMVRFSPDGRRVVTASSDKTARVWDAVSGEPVGQPLMHGGKVNAAEFSPDGMRVVTAPDGGVAGVWAVGAIDAADAESGSPGAWPLKLRREGDPIYAAFSPDGRRVVTTGGGRTAQVWDARSGQPVGEVIEHGASVRMAEFSPDSRRVLTASWDRTARIWDAETGRPLTPTMKHGDRVRSARFSPDGLRVVTASIDQSVRVWDAFTGEPLTEPILHGHRARWAEFSPDGLAVVSASEDGTAQLWDIRPGRQLGEPLPGGTYGAAEFNGGGEQIAIPGNEIVLLKSGPSGWVPILRRRADPMNDVVKAQLVRFSPDGRVMLTTLDTGQALLRDARTGQPFGKRIVHEGHITAAEFSPDGSRVVTASFDRTARIWDGRTGKALAPPMVHENEVWGAEFSPDGRQVLTASLDGTARLWEAGSGRPLAGPLRHGRQVHSARFSPDGQLVATGSNDRTVGLWNPASGEPLGKPLRHERSAKMLRFNADGSRLVVITEGGAAWIWEVATRRRHPNPLRHEGEITSAEFSPDGRRVLTAAGDGTARVWDAVTGHPLADAFVHGAILNAARYSPDGRRILASPGTVDGLAPVLWSCVEIPSPVPDWVCDLSDALTTAPVAPQDGIGRSSWERLRELRLRSTGSEGTNDYATWGRWFFADRAERTIAPFSNVPIEVYLVARLRAPWLGAALEVLQCQPTNRLALARQGRRFVPDDRYQNEDCRRIGLRGYELLQAALDHLVLSRAEQKADDPVLLWTALNYWMATSQISKGLVWIDEGIARDPERINWWIARGALLEISFLENEARPWYAKAVELTRRCAEPPSVMRDRMLISRGRLLRSLGATNESQADYRSEWNIAPRDPATSPNAIDLSPFYNRAFKDVVGLSDARGSVLNDLGGIRPGRHRVGDVEFDVRGIVQIFGRDEPVVGGPNRIEGIAIGGRHRRLHFLHASQAGQEHGEKSGRYVIHFADGGSTEVPLVSGIDLAHWNHGPADAEAPSNAEAVLFGKNAAGEPIHLFHLRWENPRPDVEIVSLDFEAAWAPVQPFLVALTVE